MVSVEPQDCICYAQQAGSWGQFTPSRQAASRQLCLSQALVQASAWGRQSPASRQQAGPGQLCLVCQGKELRTCACLAQWFYLTKDESDPHVTSTVPNHCPFVQRYGSTLMSHWNLGKAVFHSLLWKVEVILPATLACTAVLSLVPSAVDLSTCKLKQYSWFAILNHIHVALIWQNWWIHWLYILIWKCILERGVRNIKSYPCCK